MNLERRYHWKFALFCMLLISCKALQSALDVKSKDIYAITVKDKKTAIVSVDIKKGKSFIQTRGWIIPDSSPDFKRGVILVNQKDTMLVLCLCYQLNNYYFSNVDFKKGTFFIDTAIPLKEKLGKQVDLPNSVQNILFRNALISDKGYDLKDLLLKDVKFKVIDFSDKENIQLIPISEDKFWDNNFVPESLKNW